MPTTKSLMDKIVGPTTPKSFRTIDRQVAEEHRRAQIKPKPQDPPEPECDWRRLLLKAQTDE